MSVNGKRKGITRADLVEIGQSIRCKMASEIIDENNDVVNQWEKLAKDVAISSKLKLEIGKTILGLSQ